MAANKHPANLQERQAKLEPKKNTTSESLEELDVNDILETVPEESKKIMELLSVQMGGIVSSENAIMKKITEDHITTFLASSDKNMVNSYKEKRDSKIFIFSSLVLGMLFILAIIIILKDTPDVMEKIIYTVGGVIIGAFGGYGFGKHKRDD